jgi:hypothetical protein
MSDWLSLPVVGTAYWPREEMKVSVQHQEVILKPETPETEKSIHVELRGIDASDAFTLASRFLSVLSWCSGQPLENLDGFVWRRPEPVRKQSRPVGESIDITSFRDIPRDPRGRKALALYREAQTVNSIPFSFLSYFKILNIFWPDNQIVDGLRNLLPLLNDDETQDRIKELATKTEDVAQYLYSSGRCAVAHAYAEPIVDPDDVTHTRRLSEDIWIIRAAAEYLIENKLHISREIIAVG